MKDLLNVLIVGAGSIGGLKPNEFDSPTNHSKILTHCHAVKFLEEKKHLKLTGIVEPNLEKLCEVKLKWNISEGYITIDEYLKTSNYADIITIASPTITHYEIVKQILLSEKKPKIIILEKPGGYNLNECTLINNLSSEYKVPILINYIRRFNSHYQTIGNLLKSGFYGKILNASLCYTRGLKRDCCHAIDIFNWFFGDFTSGQSLSYSNLIDDYDTNDLTEPFYLQYENCPHVFLRPCDGRKGSIFEIDIIAEKARIIFVDNGTKINIHNVQKEKIWGDYSVIPSECKTIINNEFTIDLINVYKNAIDYLSSTGDIARKKLCCTIDDALNVYKIIDNLRYEE